MSPRINAKRLIAVIGCTLCAVGVSAFAYQVTRARLSESILAKIDRLSLHPPDDIPELEWAVLVYWTHNLHCESTPQTSLSLRDLRRLDNDVTGMLATGPNQHSIDMLWDRYASMTDGGAKYREKYEPVRDSVIDAIVKDGDAYFDCRSYTDFVASVRVAAEH